MKNFELIFIVLSHYFNENPKHENNKHLEPKEKMKKQTRSNRQTMLFAVLSTVTLMFAASANVAAQKGKFKVGDKVECDGTGTGYWQKGTIVPYLKSDDPETANYYRFSLDRYPDEEGRICAFKDMRPLTTAAPKEDPGEQPKEIDGKETPADKEKPNETKAGRFKVGDRVESCGMQLKDNPDCWENGTIVKDIMPEGGGDNYQVLVDDPKGGRGSLYYIPSKWIRAGAPPKPATPDCPFNEPAGSASKTAKPSAATFKRAIFEFHKGNAAGRQVGVTYQTFELGKSYVNRLTNNGLLHTGAPQNAMIYTVKTKFITCEKYTTSTMRMEYDSKNSCFQNSFGDWICPVDTVKISTPIHLPNK